MKTKAVVVILALVALTVTSAFAGGAETYKAKCAMCHGADGKGGKMAPVDLGGADVQKQSDADLTTIITKGKAKMPSYESKLSAGEIKGTLEFIRSLKK
jgi:Cytochrome c.